MKKMWYWTWPVLLIIVSIVGLTFTFLNFLNNTYPENPAIKNVPRVEYYNIYLCNKPFRGLDLEKVLALEEESSNYCITAYKSWDIDLRNRILNVHGVGAFACTSSSQTKDGNHKYVRIQPVDMKIALDHQWMVCIIEEKIKNKEEYYVTVYGRELSTYKLLLPRTKVE